MNKQLQLPLFPKWYKKTEQYWLQCLKCFREIFNDGKTIRRKTCPKCGYNGYKGY
jgi:rRNA maturation endonuclease Nob1